MLATITPKALPEHDSTAATTDWDYYVPTLNSR